MKRWFEVFLPQSYLEIPVRRVKEFMQEMAYRLMQGKFRYGRGDAAQRYMSRLLKEVEAYKRSGNAEALVNIANYALLERLYPEHPQFHWNKIANSNTRSEFGGEKQ